MASKVKVAVLGTGSLGQNHVRIYAELAAAGQVELAGIYDSSAETARKIAAKHNARIFNSVAEAAAAADALNIVTPTTTHFELAKLLLQQGKHVLVEKPMTDSSEQAAELIQIAQQKNCVLQVGHVERFNPVFTFLQTVATEPKFIECHRLSPFPARSTDIGVVLDLMIHDLDVVLAFVKSPVTSVDGVGIPVLSKSEDIANARLRFANGCVANLTASRVCPERMRKIRVFSGPTNPCYISLDYRVQEGLYFTPRPRRRGRKLAAEKSSRRQTGHRQRLHHRQPVCRQKNRARAGADCEGRTAQAGTAKLRQLRPRKTDAGRQRRIRQTRAGPGL